jgi:hypothetical protein
LINIIVPVAAKEGVKNVEVNPAQRKRLNCLPYNEREIDKLIKEENAILEDAEHHSRG